MTTTYTPGPWQVNSFDPLQVCDADGERRGCAPIATTHGRAAEARANARLIASAPALLEALAALVNYSNLGAYERAAAMKAARAAIAAATGE